MPWQLSYLLRSRIGSHIFQPEHVGAKNPEPKGDVMMPNQPRDGQRLFMPYSPSSRKGNGELAAAPSKLAEAAMRILGACLLLYPQQVPTREYYEVQQTYQGSETSLPGCENIFRVVKQAHGNASVGCGS